MAGSEDGSELDNSIAKALEAVMGRSVKVASARVRDADAAKFAEQLWCDQVMKMGLKDTA